MRQVVLVAVAMVACAPASTSIRREVPALPIIIESDGTLGADEALVEDALRAASARLGRFGGLTTPVTIVLVEDHDALERAVARPGYSWLRAWARYDTVLLQAPHTWARAEEELETLLLHELTHCELFQQTGSERTWRSRQIPLWFREGMALHTAEQGKSLPTLEDVATYLSRVPRPDVFADGERLSRDDGELVYALSFQAYGALLRRYGGLARVNELLASMRGGHRFDVAFLVVYGVTVRTFQRDVENWLVLRAYRGHGRMAPSQGQPRPDGD